MTKKLRLGIILMVFLLLAGTASAYPRAVLFTFDDARASVYTTGYPIFANHGYNATFYVITDNIKDEYYPGKSSINLSQLRALYNAGWDIGDHTKNHEYFVTDSLSLSEQIDEIQGGKAKLDEWGFTRASKHLAFPGGEYDSNTTLAMTSVGMLTGRTTQSFPLTVPPFNNNSFYLTGVRGDLDPIYTDEQFSYLESLSSDNVVIYLAHGVDDPGAGASTITSGMLENMLDYMDTHHIPVWTITQLYANISASGSYSPTPHTMTIYPTVDGEVSRWADNSTFSNIISGDGTNVADKATTFFGPVISTGAGTQSGKFETSTVGVLSFDTSSIPDNATIESASLVLHQAYPSQDNLGRFTVVITNGTIASGTSLQANDYQTRGDWELTERKPFTHITTGNNTFDFKTDGLSWINKKGSTVLFLRRGDDIDGAYAGGPTWTQNEQSEHRWDSTEATDSGERPYLQIDYTISAPVKPVASFTGTPVSGTVPLTVVFTDSSSGTSITNRRWDFGDGNISSYVAATNPTHVYSSAGTYSVNLTVTNASGSNSQRRSNYISISGGSPTFVATTSGSSDGEVDRTNSGSGESFASLRNGAGTTADPTGSYLYVGIRSADNNNANSYDVLQRDAFLFNTSGLPDNAIITGATLSVWSGISSDFKNQLGTTSYGVTGINTLTPGVISQNDYQNLVNTRYSDTDIPQTQIANYNYNTWVFNAAGISAISKTGWTNVTVRTKWDIDNDTTGLTWLPYQSTTQVLLYAAETHVGKEPTLTISYTLPSTSLPVASFTGTPVSGNVPLTVVFTDSSSGASITNHRWDFGDGNISIYAAATNPTHVYSSAGTYSVNLTVTNASGSNSLLRSNYITVSAPVKPVASFTGTPVSGTVPLTVVFTDSSSGTSITNRRWDFGDGNISSYAAATNPTHVYSSAGTYSVNLTVTNASGSNSQLRSNYITVNERPPVSGFSGTPTTGTIPLTVTFTDGSTGVITGYAWNFGDTATSTDKNPSHQYTKAGTYTVNLTVTGPGGTNTSTRSNYVTVRESPIRTTNVGVFQPGGIWYLDVNNNGTWDSSPPDKEFSWGKRPGDIPLTGDWNGDNITETGIFRSGGTWYLDTNNNGTWDGTPPDKAFSWGKQPGDIPITGDWNGDNITETGIFRSGGTWYLDMNNNGTWDGSPPDKEFSWGKQPGDIPITGDWNGNGITETGIFRPGTGFYLDMNNNGAWDATIDKMLTWGLQPNDIPVTGDWNGDGITETGIFRNGDWYLDINNNGHWDPGTDVIYPIGQPGDKPVTGKWE